MIYVIMFLVYFLLINSYNMIVGYVRNNPFTPTLCISVVLYFIYINLLLASFPLILKTKFCKNLSSSIRLYLSYASNDMKYSFKMCLTSYTVLNL